jgi:predicted NAD/FAD-binding protein
LAELGVETAKSDMSFSVQVPGALSGRTLEWSGTNLRHRVCPAQQPGEPALLGMLRDLLRFKCLCTRIARPIRTMPR